MSLHAKRAGDIDYLFAVQQKADSATQSEIEESHDMKTNLVMKGWSV